MVMKRLISNPFILRWILNSLPLFDVYKCRLVSKLWYKEAVRQLKMCPMLDSLTILMEGSDPERDLSSFKIDLTYPGKTSDRLKIPDIKTNLEIFFTKSMKFLPSLSFINSDFYISDIIYHLPVNHPTILIGRDSFKLYPKKFNMNFEFGCVDLKEKASRKVFFDAMHFSRYPSNHKIIMTDWADPKSSRPDFWDESFPIKAIIYFSSGFEFQQPCYGDFVDFVEYSYLKEWSGGCLYPFVTDIPFIDRDHGEWKYSPGLSITFAGKEVEAAIFEEVDDGSSDDEFFDRDVNDIPKPIDVQLEEFKRNLNFPTDDGRVIGFMFLDRIYEVELGRFLTIEMQMVREAFPKVPFMRIRAIDRVQYGLVNFHLIRI